MDKRLFYDVSMPIEKDMISWPSDGPVKVARVRSMDQGERLNQSRIDISAHTGTHIDAPVHFLRNGMGIDDVPVEVLIGQAVVVHIPGARELGEEQFQSAYIKPETERLLIKTDNVKLIGKSEFDTGYAHITLEGANHLIEKGIRLVGVDYLSVAEYGNGGPVHRALLEAGMVIVEGLDLRDVPEGSYKMIALPLRIKGCDGAPARVVLEKEE